MAIVLEQTEEQIQEQVDLIDQRIKEVQKDIEEKKTLHKEMLNALTRSQDRVLRSWEEGNIYQTLQDERYENMRWVNYTYFCINTQEWMGFFPLELRRKLVALGLGHLELEYKERETFSTHSTFYVFYPSEHIHKDCKWINFGFSHYAYVYVKDLEDYTDWWKEHVKPLTLVESSTRILERTINELCYEREELSRKIEYRVTKESWLQLGVDPVTVSTIVEEYQAWRANPADVERKTWKKTTEVMSHGYPDYWLHWTSTDWRQRYDLQDLIYNVMNIYDRYWNDHELYQFLNEGTLPVDAYKKFRTNHNREWRGVTLPQSSKIGKLLEAFKASDDLKHRFNHRGGKKLKTNLFISNEVMPLLHITEWASGWDSCQAWGKDQCAVWSNPSDPDLYVLWAGGEQEMKSRTLVRLCEDENGNELAVLIRHYGDRVYRQAFKEFVTATFGCPAYDDEEDKPRYIRGRSEVTLPPSGKQPYLDCGNWSYVKDNTYRWFYRSSW